MTVLKAPVKPTIPDNIKAELLVDAARTALLPEQIDANGEQGRLKNGTTLSLVEGTPEHEKLNEQTAALGVKITENIEPSVMHGALAEEKK